MVARPGRGLVFGLYDIGRTRVSVGFCLGAGRLLSDSLYDYGMNTFESTWVAVAL
jgi:hypothetical protein